MHTQHPLHANTREISNLQCKPHSSHIHYTSPSATHFRHNTVHPKWKTRNCLCCRWKLICFSNTRTKKKKIEGHGNEKAGTSAFTKHHRKKVDKFRFGFVENYDLLKWWTNNSWRLTDATSKQTIWAHKIVPIVFPGRNSPRCAEEFGNS